jgi:hypothetical protein
MEAFKRVLEKANWIIPSGYFQAEVEIFLPAAALVHLGSVCSSLLCVKLSQSETSKQSKNPFFIQKTQINTKEKVIPSWLRKKRLNPRPFLM